MSLVFAAITPHPPLLLPSIGKENAKKVKKTQQAFARLEEDLYLAKPDVIIIISPHGELLKDAFTINFCSEFNSDLRQFGDLTTQLKLKGDMGLPARISSKGKEQEYRVVMNTCAALDHGAVVPLYFLTTHLPNITVMPVGYSELDYKTHLEFGYLIKDAIMNTNKRVAIIASGDLSHALATDAPAGFNKNGEIFDAKIQELLATRNTAGMLQLDPKFLKEAAECGFRSFLILMGILRDVNYKYESYSYEAPFGVGYLTANFIL